MNWSIWYSKTSSKRHSCNYLWCLVITLDFILSVYRWKVSTSRSLVLRFKTLCMSLSLIIHSYPTAKTRQQKLHLWRDRFHPISWNRKIHVIPLPEAIISFCACFDKVVRPRQDILEQKSTVTAQNRCPKIRRDKPWGCCKASILATGQRLSFIIIVLQALALSYQSRSI